MNEDRSARYHTLGRRAAVASAAWSAGLLVCLAATPFSSTWPALAPSTKLARCRCPSTGRSCSNAALTGLGRTRRILVSDTLLATHSDDEIEVILAHELGHQVRHDLWKGIAIQVVVAGLGFLVASRVLSTLASRLGWTGAADVAGLPVLLLAVGVVALVLLPAVTAAARAMERAAVARAWQNAGGCKRNATLRRL